MKDISMIAKLAAFAVIVNVINIFDCEAALLTVVIGMAYGIMRVGYFCCTGR